MRPAEIPPALNGQPFRTVDAYALGVSLKTLQGSRFRRIAKGVYVASATADTHRLRVRGAMLALPPSTIATGVTGLQLLGVAIGPEVPMVFASTHPRPVRRREVTVIRVKQLPPHRDGIAAPEHCWLVAASTLNLLDLVTAGDWLIRCRRTGLVQLQSAVQEYSGRGVVLARTAVKLVRERVDVTAHGIAPDWAVTAHSAAALGGELLRHRQRVGEAEPRIKIIAVEAGHGLNAIG